MNPDVAACPGFVPLQLPEFSGKVVRLADLLDEDLSYIRQGDDLLARGLYLDLPAYGGHIYRISRKTWSPAQRRRSATQ